MIIYVKTTSSNTNIWTRYQAGLVKLCGYDVELHLQIMQSNTLQKNVDRTSVLPGYVHNYKWHPDQATFKCAEILNRNLYKTNYTA